MFRLIEKGLKHAAQETQDYVRLVLAAIRAIFSPPLYRHDIIEQFDAIGVGSLTVVLLTGFFTGAALASQTGLTLDQFGRARSSGVSSVRRWSRSSGPCSRA